MESVCLRRGRQLNPDEGGRRDDDPLVDGVRQLLPDSPISVGLMSPTATAVSSLAWQRGRAGSEIRLMDPSRLRVLLGIGDPRR